MIVKLKYIIGGYIPIKEDEVFTLDNICEITQDQVEDVLGVVARKVFKENGFYKTLITLSSVTYIINLDMLQDEDGIDFRGRGAKIRDAIDKHFLGKVLEKIA
jgi:hypothetical protein